MRKNLPGFLWLLKFSNKTLVTFTRKSIFYTNYESLLPLEFCCTALKISTFYKLYKFQLGMILKQNTQFLGQLMYEHIFQAAIREFFLWKHIHTGSRPIQATIKSTSIQLWVYNSGPHICMLPRHSVWQMGWLCLWWWWWWWCWLSYCLLGWHCVVWQTSTNISEETNIQLYIFLWTSSTT